MKYVLGKTTLRELYRKSNQTNTYNDVSLYRYQVPRTFTPAQEKIQRNHSLYAKHCEWYSYREDVFYNRVKNALTYEIINQRYKGNIFQKVYDRLMDEEIIIVGEVFLNETEKTSRVNIKFETKKEEGEQYSNDTKKFEKELEQVKSFAPGQYGTPLEARECVYLEEVCADAQIYSMREIDTKLARLIKKIMREEYTYCTKNGAIIIPDTYLDKGEEGIKEWRNLKSSRNKNNSMEKRMLKQVYRDKKLKATSYLDKIIYLMVSPNFCYEIPSLQVEGRWNSAKVDKLTNKIMNTKNKQEFLDMSDEEMLAKIKKYWKEILAQAYDRVDKYVDEQ